MKIKSAIKKNKTSFLFAFPFTRGCGVLPVVIIIFGMSSAVSAQSEDREGNENWGEWRALDSGFVARRRQPPKINLPKAARQLKRVQERRSKLVKQRNRLLHQLSGKNIKGAKAKKLQRQGAVLRQRISRFDDKSTNRVVRTRAGRANRLPALWMYTGFEGLYSVSLDNLATELGKKANQIRRRAEQGQLSLTNGRRQVPWYFDAENDQFMFVGEQYETFYTDENAYRFRISGDKKKPPMEQISGAATAASGAAEPFIEFLKYEEEPDLFFAPWSVASEPDADYWFWDYLYGGFKDTISVELNAPNPALSGSAQLRITMRGWTNIEQGDEHEVYAELNGQIIGSSIIWDGMEEAVLITNFNQSLLDESGSNSLKLKNHYSEGTHPGQWLDQIELDYRRKPIADDGQLWLHNVAGGAQVVSGFVNDDILVIEAPNGDAVLRHDVRVESTGSAYAVTFEAIANTDYLVVERSAATMPTIVADERSKLRKKDNMADYLIIAPKVLEGTARALADHRLNQYSYVKVVLLEDIYDEFSAGREDPFAITRFMAKVDKSWQLTPSVVVLIGKGTLDHKDRMGYADSFLPAVMTNTPFSLASSDDRLLGISGAASFSVGRIPITNDSEGVAYVNKLVNYETAVVGTEKFQALLVADNPDEAGNFHDNSNLLAEHLAENLGFDSVTKLYHPNDSVRSALIQNSAWETGYISYDGHGSTTQVGDGSENFIKTSDAQMLTNSVYPVFTALTCAAGDGTIPGIRSLAGALVLNPTGGAIASFAPTGLSLDYDAQILGNAFINSLFISGYTLGDAAKEAKALTNDGQIKSYMRRIYSVIGDPAIYAR